MWNVVNEIVHGLHGGNVTRRGLGPGPPHAVTKTVHRKHWGAVDQLARLGRRRPLAGRARFAFSLDRFNLWHPRILEVGMRAMMRVAAGLAVALFVVAGPAAAQRPQVRHGFWIGFGFGYGSASLSCGSGCAFNDAAKGGGGTGFLKLGGTLSPKVLLGGDITVWVKDVSGTTESAGNVSFAAYFYPAPASGFFLKGGAGFGSFMLRDGGSAEANGVGLVAGLGYDIRVGRNISITPVGNFYFGSDGDLKDSGTVLIPSVKHTVFDLGLGITFH